MEEHVGVMRSGASLTTAIAALLKLAQEGGPASDPATIGLMIATAALARTESRGGHWRSDFPVAVVSQASRQVQHLDEVLAVARRVASKSGTFAAGA